MKLVLDANVLISALLGSRRTIGLIRMGQHSFYAPRKIVDEVVKYAAETREKAGQTSDEFKDTLAALLVFINVTSPETYASHLDHARSLLEKRDANDAEYLALAFTIQADAVWTNDKDFTVQKNVRVLSTDALLAETD